ncbi:MAG: hypothetical protein ABI051_16305 [Vicinamibacterales bacterium]
MTEPPRLRRYDYYLGRQSLGDTWTLRRGALTMRCALTTNQLGWELRLTAGPNLLRTQVCKSESDVHAVSDAWQAEARVKGWS